MASTDRNGLQSQKGLNSCKSHFWGPGWKFPLYIFNTFRWWNLISWVHAKTYRHKLSHLTTIFNDKMKIIIADDVIWHERESLEVGMMSIMLQWLFVGFPANQILACFHGLPTFGWGKIWVQVRFAMKGYVCITLWLLLVFNVKFPFRIGI